MKKLPVLQETMFEEMKRYVRFNHEDICRLAAFHPKAAPFFPQIAVEFYERIREHEPAHNVFTGEEQIERLQKSLVRWMHRVFLGPHDECYFQETAKIGRIHVQIGLEQRYMFTAMALVRASLGRIADDTMGPDAPAVRETVSRVLDLELAIMLEAYRNDCVQRIQHAAQLEQEELGRTLQRTEHRYVHAVELARLLIVGLDRQGRIRLFNREAERVTGYARDEALGERLDELLCPELGDAHTEILGRALRGELPPDDTVECAIQTRTGKLRDVIWQLGYRPNELEEDDEVLFAIGRDVTDEKQLAARVRQSEKLAAVGTLAAGLAHEIRNPLNGALLHVTFLDRGLKRNGADADTLDAVRIVGDEIKRLGTLVSEFLDFARPKPLDKKPVSVHALCNRVLSLVSGAASKTHVKLSSELPATDIMLDADGSKLQQVLLNIVQNAIDVMQPTGGSMVLRARRQPRQAVIEIEDDGPGLADAEAPIFDPFYSTKPNGTGLGLSIVHRIVTDHDGTIQVQSEPGKTVFRIALPIDFTALATATT